MLAFIGYVILYFVLGFVIAKFKKFYDTTNNISNHDKLSYATFGLVWLPYLALKGSIFAIAFIHGVFKEKL